MLAEFYLDNMMDVCPNTTYIRENTVTCYPSGCDVVDSIASNHYGFISTFSDGIPSYIKVCSGSNTSGSKYLWANSDVKDYPCSGDLETDNGLNKMDNRYYPSIYFSPFSNTMSYDSHDRFNIATSYGESFTMGKDYGGPVYMGMTQDAYYDSSPNKYSYDYYSFTEDLTGYIANGKSVLGEAFLMTKSCCNYDNYWSYMVSCYDYLGDPSLDMWTDEPLQYSNITVTRTDNSVTITGMPSTSTSIAYHSNDGTVGLITAPGSSVTYIGVPPNSTLMLYSHNRIPYIAPLVLQNTDLENSQYVIASDVIAGKSVDSGRTTGEVTVKDGAEYEIEASGIVTLDGGFKVEKGAIFNVRKSTYK